MAKILIIGGTRFMGYFAADYALARGHEVTLFNRGQSDPAAFPTAEHILGDRDNDADLAKLQGRQWDIVIDTCGYVPRIVRKSLTLLRDSVQRYIFISSISVYPDIPAGGVDESGALAVLADPTTENATGEAYGGLKVLCEQAVETAFPDRTLIVRSGIIVGPRDTSDRFSYWIRRIAQGGEVLAPGKPDFPVQFIDARDLGEWIVHMAETRQTGIYNAVGPAQSLGMATFLDACKVVSASDSAFTWVDEAFLLEHNVTPWSELPLWLPEEWQGHNIVKRDRAIAAGLTYRPLSETIRATLDWLITDDPYRPGGKPTAALTRQREGELLQGWHAKTGSK